MRCYLADKTNSLMEVYCDGGVWGGVMADAITAHPTEFVGRTAVIIPGSDYGVIDRFHDFVALANGHENVFYSEFMAVRNAAEACARLGLHEGAFVIYSDNGGVVKESHLPYVTLIHPDKFHYADEYLYVMRCRAGYLRRTTGRVRSRRPISPIHAEIARLMGGEHVEFHLSESPLFQRFCSEAQLNAGNQKR
jgi:hypothetical protein